MSRAERHELAALLAELDEPAAPARQREPLRPDPYRIDPVLARERRLALLVSAGCCVFLAGWIVLLAATLPHHFDAHHWRAVWVNFDAFLLAAFAVTAWAIWRQRQVLILLLVLIGTMLCCDAWFDVGTSLATSGFGISLLSAALAELPLAFLAFAGARRLLRATVAAGILAGARPRPRLREPGPARRARPSPTPSTGRRSATGAGPARASPFAARRWPAPVSTRPCRAPAPSGGPTGPGDPAGPGDPVSRPDRGRAQNSYVITEAELRRMTPDERRQLARTLAIMDRRHPLVDPRLRRRRRFGLLFMTACCLALAAWIAILILTLPMRYTSHDWRVVWVGLDIAELAGFAATAWAAWHQRQILIFVMVVTGTLLVCDAWFDLALAYGSRGFTMSLVSAFVVELPLALLLFTSARRLVRVTMQTMMQLSGITGPAPPLWRSPLFAHGLEEALPARLRQLGTQPRAPLTSDVTAAGGPSSLGIRRFLGIGAIPRGDLWTRASTPNTAR